MNRHVLGYRHNCLYPGVKSLVNSRRGMILGQEQRTGAVQVDANIPLSNMFGYATDLRSKTQGRGQYVMEPSHYTAVPKSIADDIISARTKG